MDDFSDEFKKYWKDTSQHLSTYVTSKRDHEVEQLITSTLFFFAYSTEDLTSKVTKNQNDLNKLNSYIIIAIDTLRGLLRCQEELSLASLSLLNRMTFEIHCNLQYMFSHQSPAQMIDRNFRFGDVEKYKHSQQIGAAVKLSREQEIQIKKNCPEWFDVSGKLIKAHYCWNAEPTVGNFREITKVLKMEEQYVSLYSTNSKFVHGSSLTLNMYRDNKKKVHFNGSTIFCSSISIATCNYWLDTLENYTNYFGITINEDDFFVLKISILSLMEKSQ